MPVDYLITGACGMVGSHLVDRFEQSGTPYIGTYFNPQARAPEAGNPRQITCDIRDAQHVHQLIATHRPRIILHLAAQSYPTVSWQRPMETMDINVGGTLNVLESVLRLRKEDGYDPSIVIACSSAEYGASMTPENVPISENAPLLPLHPYGISKVSQDLLGFQYHACFGLRAVRARIFNTTGARKKNDVISDWARGVVAIENGKENVLRVGNLNAKRAVMDVQDLMRALLLLAEKGAGGETYNICHDQLTDMQGLLELFKSLSLAPFTHEVDTALLRPVDEAVIYGDNRRLKALGWQPSSSLRETVAAVLAYERKASDSLS